MSNQGIIDFDDFILYRMRVNCERTDRDSRPVRRIAQKEYGEDSKDTELLRAMAAEAEEYLLSFRLVRNHTTSLLWCGRWRNCRRFLLWNSAQS